MTIKTVIFVSLFIANIATAQPLDLQRGKRNYQLVLEGKRKIDSFSQAEINEVLQVLQLQETKKNKNQFTVVAGSSSCKYFVTEQGSNYSLVEDWLCFRPSRNDIGYGDVNSYGMKEITLNGMRCTAYVDNWLMSKSSAIERMTEKCAQ